MNGLDESAPTLYNDRFLISEGLVDKKIDYHHWFLLSGLVVSIRMRSLVSKRVNSSLT